MIVRAPRPRANFYVLDKRISEDRRLSWAARGMLVFLLGKPDNWTVSASALVSETSDCTRPSGRDAVYATLKELIDTGYMVRVPLRAENGTHGGVQYIVGETPRSPLPDQPLPDQPDTDKPHTANPTLTRTDSQQELIEEQGLNKPKPKRKAPKPEAVIKPAEWIDTKVWADFVEHRRQIKAKLTQIAADRLLVTLAKARDMGHDPNEMLNKSIEMGWRGVFIPRGNNPPSFGQPPKTAQRDEWLNGGRHDKETGNVIDVVATTIIE